MADPNTLADWEEYQQRFELAPDSCSTAFSAFANDSTRLFAKEENKLCVEVWEAQQQKTTSSAVNAIYGSADALNNIITRIHQGRETAALNIPQATSWSRLKVNFSTFAHLCNIFQIAPPFLEIASTFGFRREDSDNFFSSSLWRVVPASISKQDTKAYDICYNFRYVELHNRAGAEPWSHRNYAVYHRYYRYGKSVWLYLHLPEALKAQVALAVGKGSRRDGHALLLHLSFLRFAIRKWRHYINYLEGKVLDISKAVAFVRLGNRTGVDFELDFSSGQKLSAMRQKIDRSIGTIHSYSSIIKTLVECSKAMARENYISEEEAEHMAQGMDELSRTGDSYIKKLEALMRSCNFTADLLFQFLKSRNDAAVHQTTSMLKIVMEESAVEIKSMAWLNQQSCAEARGTKITTRISMFYAPAALITGVFSSDLIKARSDVSVGVLAGIFVITVIALTTATVAVNWYLERQQSRALRLKPASDSTSSLSHPAD